MSVCSPCFLSLPEADGWMEGRMNEWINEQIDGWSNILDEMSFADTWRAIRVIQENSTVPEPCDITRDTDTLTRDYWQHLGKGSRERGLEQSVVFKFLLAHFPTLFLQSKNKKTGKENIFTRWDLILNTARSSSFETNHWTALPLQFSLISYCITRCKIDFFSITCF